MGRLTPDRLGGCYQFALEFTGFFHQALSIMTFVCKPLLVNTAPGRQGNRSFPHGFADIQLSLLTRLAGPCVG